MNQIQKITSLVQELNKHRNAYYNLNAPTITYKEYDQLFDELQQLETETGFILSNSPTQTVGYYPVSSLSKVQHPIPLLSLEKDQAGNGDHSASCQKPGITDAEVGRAYDQAGV